MEKSEFAGLRLLLVVNEGSHFVSHSLGLARQAQAAGFEVHVACPPRAEDALLEKSGSVVHPILLERRGTNPFKELRTLMALIELQRPLRPDVTHRFTIKSVLHGGLASRRARRPHQARTVTGFGYLIIVMGVKASALRALIVLLYLIALRGRESRVIFQNRDDLQLFLAEGLVTEARASSVRGSGVVDTQLMVPVPAPPLDATSRADACRKLAYDPSERALIGRAARAPRGARISHGTRQRRYSRRLSLRPPERDAN